MIKKSKKKRLEILILVLFFFIITTPFVHAEEEKIEFEVKATTTHPDQCQFTIHSIDENLVNIEPPVEQGGLDSSEDGRTHTKTVSLAQDRYRLKIDCNLQATAQTIFSIIITDSQIWVVEPESIEEKPSFGISDQVLFDLILESERDVTCKYSKTPGSIGPNSNQDELSNAFQSIYEEFESLTNNRFKKSDFDMSNIIPDYQFRGTMGSLNLICEEELVEGEKSYFYFEIQLASDTRTLSITSIKKNPSLIIDPRRRYTDIEINTNQRSICWMSEKSDVSGITYTKNSKDIYTSVDNFSTRTNDRINFPDVNELDAKFEVTCENLAGQQKSKNITIPIEILINPNPIVIHPRHYISQTSSELLIETQIETDRCSYSLKENPAHDDFKPLSTQNKINHTAQLTNLKEGTNTITYICDGSDLRYVYEFFVDTTPPSNVDIRSEDLTCGAASFPIRLSAEDNQSGIKKYLINYQVQGSDQKSFNTTSSSTSIPLSIQDQGKSLTIRARAKNVAGLQSSSVATKTVSITNSSILQCDRTPPTPILDKEFSNETSKWEVTVNCQDENGCKNQFSYGLALTGQCQFNKTSTLNTTLEIDPPTRFCYKVFDNNNNNASGIVTLEKDYPLRCFNEIKDGDETDVDCGGSCPSCSVGSVCSINSDCDSNFCSFGRCVEATCSDGFLNQDETDIDCGGSSCPSCSVGRMCKVDSDCLSGNCADGRCQEPSCNNNKTDGDQTDVDCGGETCEACELGKTCKIDSDCQTGFCDSGTCRNPVTQEENPEANQRTDRQTGIQTSSSLPSLILTVIGFFLMITGIGLIYYDHSFKQRKPTTNQTEVPIKPKQETTMKKVEETPKKPDPETEKKKQEALKKAREQKLKERKEILSTFKQEKIEPKKQEKQTENKELKQESKKETPKKEAGKEDDEDIVLGQEKEDAFEKLKNIKK
ncbi:MAG: hypothetical protein ACMXX7_01190 [Candidatus Woesearchaeota archaeon]